jgi:predicted kinase
VALLILLNGPPGLGKSTLARRYVEEHPLALDLDVDVVRGLLGRWADDPVEAGLAARAMAREMARVHLLGGHDVIVPQYVARPRFVGELEALEERTGAVFREVVLMDARPNALRRNVTRGEPEELSAHMYDRLQAYLLDRPDARQVPTAAGQPDAAYAALLEALGQLGT